MKLLAIDGNSILNRAFYGVRGLTNSKGIPTNAIFGFFNTLEKTLSDINPDMVAVAFDLKEPTFRHEKYAQYKANRHGMPDDLAAQLPITKDIIKAMGFHVIECPGFEADDVMGTFARICREQNVDCVISSGDRDNLQLVGEGVEVRLATNKEAIVYDADKVKEQYGVTSKQLIEVKALMGDSSDNIPGVKGIGEKTAFNLIEKYGDINYIFNNTDSLEVTARVKNLLSTEQAKESALMSHELGTIVDNAPIDEDLSKYKTQERDNQALSKIFGELELKKFIERYGLDIEQTPIKPKEQKVVSFDILENPSEQQAKELIEKSEIIDFIMESSRLLMILGDTIVEYNFQQEEMFYKLVAESDKPKRTHMAKETHKQVLEMGGQLKHLEFSTELAAYLLDAIAKSYELETLIQKYTTTSYDVEERYKKIAAFPELCKALEEKLKKKGMYKLLMEVELPLSLVLADMEQEGFQVDVAGVRAFGEMLGGEISRLTQEIYDLAEEEFNINSTKELSHILFDKLELPTGKKTKTGYSTNVDILEKMSPLHPIAGKVLEYRKLTKLNSTYVVGLLKVTGADSRVHSLFKQTETRTGRISSTEPNMQNIPIRTELGREMRRFFTAKGGCTLLDADYSQIELRILAHISDDKNMIDGFNHNADIHKITASQVFGVPMEQVDSELRRRAKAINFGIVYGIGAYSLSQDIHVSVAEARQYIDNYLNNFSGVKKYMSEIVEESTKTGQVKTMFGRIRELPEIRSSNKITKAFGERVALNTPIQGSAADIIKIAMVRVYNRLKQEKLDAKLILQVHDELLIEATENDAKKAKNILKQEMEDAAQLSVELKVDVSQGKTWYDTKD